MAKRMDEFRICLTRGARTADGGARTLVCHELSRSKVDASFLSTSSLTQLRIRVTSLRLSNEHDATIFVTDACTRVSLDRYGVLTTNQNISRTLRTFVDPEQTRH